MSQTTNNGKIVVLGDNMAFDKELEVIAHAVDKLLKYERESGEFTWLERFPPTRENKIFNTKYASKKAGTTTAKGYRQLSILYEGKLYSIRAHRMVFYIEYGHVPDIIDHIDHDKLNNFYENLREVSCRENNLNKSISASNTSGFNGVYHSKQLGKWWTEVKIKGDRVFYKLFPTFEEAVECRKALNIKYNYHHNHGMQTRIKESSCRLGSVCV